MLKDSILTIKRFLLVVTAAFCFALVGCINTEGTLDIEGRVLDEYTKKGIPHRRVVIQSLIDVDSALIPAEVVGHFCTDSAGRFSYTMNKTKDAYRYRFLFVGDSAYSFSSQEIFITEIQRNSKFLSFYLSELTDLTIKIQRNSRIVPYDTLFVSWKTNGREGHRFPYKVINFGVGSNLEFRWIGGNVNSMIEAKTLANKNTIIYLDLFRKGKKKEISDTIYCDRGEKNYFLFKY